MKPTALLTSGRLFAVQFGQVLEKVERKGFEPSTLALRTLRSPN